MPNLLAITHHNACEYLSNPLLHETVIAGTIETSKVDQLTIQGKGPGETQNYRRRIMALDDKT